MFFILLIKIIFITFINYSIVDFTFIKFFPIILPLLLSIAYLTVLERKVLAGMQRRRGPNMVGIYGLLQAIADAVKLLSKETIIPIGSNTLIFLIAPFLTYIISFMS